MTTSNPEPKVSFRRFRLTDMPWKARFAWVFLIVFFALPLASLAIHSFLWFGGPAIALMLLALVFISRSNEALDLGLVAFIRSPNVKKFVGLRELSEDSKFSYDKEVFSEGKLAPKRIEATTVADPDLHRKWTWKGLPKILATSLFAGAIHLHDFILRPVIPTMAQTATEEEIRNEFEQNPRARPCLREAFLAYDMGWTLISGAGLFGVVFLHYWLTCDQAVFWTPLTRGLNRLAVIVLAGAIAAWGAKRSALLLDRAEPTVMHWLLLAARAPAVWLRFLLLPALIASGAIIFSFWVLLFVAVALGLFALTGETGAAANAIDKAKSVAKQGTK